MPWEQYQASPPDSFTTQGATSDTPKPWEQYQASAEPTQNTSSNPVQDLFKSADFQNLPVAKQKQALEKTLTNTGAIDPSSMLYQTASALGDGPVNFLYDQYSKSPEVQQRQRDVAVGSVKQALAGVGQATTALGAKVSGSDYTPEEKQNILNDRTNQASLDALQARTPGTTGDQTLANLAVTAPLMAVMPIEGGLALAGMPEATGWLGTLARVADSSTQGLLAGETAPTSNANTPDETAAEAAQASDKSRNANASMGAKIGGAIPVVGGWLAKVAAGPVGQTVSNMTARLRGSTPEAEARTATNFTDEVNAARSAKGESTATPAQLADEIKAGMDTTSDINTKYGTNFTPTTAQTIGDIGAKNFEESTAKNAATGIRSLNKGNPDNKVMDIGTQQSNVAAETAKLLQQSNKPVDEQAVANAAQDVAGNPTQFIENKAGVTTPNITNNEVAGKVGDNITTKDTGIIEGVDNAAQAKYEEIPKNVVTPIAKTQKAISDNLSTIANSAGVGKDVKVLLNDFLDSPENMPAGHLVDLNSKLSSTVTKLENTGDPLYTDVSKALKDIKGATQEDLINSPNAEVAQKAQEARDFYRTTQETVYRQPNKNAGTVLSQTKQAMGGANTVVSEDVGHTVMSNPENIKDYVRAATFKDGPDGGEAAVNKVKDYLVTDLRKTISASPTSDAFDGWMQANKTKVDAIGAGKDFDSYKDAVLNSENQIATANKLLKGQGDAQALVKEAMTDPQKMQQLVDTVKASANGDAAIKGLQQLAQKNLEEGTLNKGIQRFGNEPESRTTAGSSDYTNRLATDADTQKAHSILWGQDAPNIEDASALMKKWDVDRANPTAILTSENLAEKAATGALAQVSHARTVTVGALDKVMQNLSNREYNRVVARFQSDPEYAASILAGYKAKTPMDVQAALTNLKNASLPVVVNASQTSKPRQGYKPVDKTSSTNMSVPDAVKYQKKSDNSSTVGNILSAMNPISDAEAATDAKGNIVNDKVPYNAEYSKMLGKLPTNAHRKLGNMVIEEAGAQGVNPKLALNIVNAESDFRAKAKAGTSSASGAFQITKGTGDDIKNRILKDKSINIDTPEGNAKAGVGLIKHITDSLKTSTGKPPPDYLVYTAYHSGLAGTTALLDKANQHASAAKLMPEAAKANNSIFYNPNGRPYTVLKVRQNLKDYYESKRLDK